MSATANGPPAWASEPVCLADADPAWALRGEQERDQLVALLAPWLIGRVEHVGSTSIPGLAAKPIIDLQALVADLADPDPLVAVLQPHGWHYVDPDVDRRPWRGFFVKVVEGRRSAHLHVMTPDCPRWHQQLIFRDALRANPFLVAEYAALKRALASEYSDDREAYSAAKADFVASVLRYSS
ncbi:GrpB family protein [Mycobacterium sp. DL99]|uniref:GrpB family protein n=1 Tax=Mycobacterium sp. DL99 TaxID=2528957 RepID=UPI0010809A11|nr:GrpB family protein [Mycobacterium sp. DL99]